MLSRLSSFSGPLSKLFTAIKGFTLNGLILRYELKDTNSYSSTNTVTDLIGNSNATLTNGPTYSSNGYLNFDGTNDYLITNTSLNSKLSPPNTSDFISHFIWMYPMDNGVIVTEQGTSSLNANWHDSQIEIVAGVLKFSVWQNITFSSSIPISLYNWYYVGLTYDGTRLRGYVNGQLAGTTTGNRSTPYVDGGGVGLHYGIAAADFTNMGDGTYAKMKLGAFHVYNTALSQQQILNNYNSQKSNYIYTEDMLIWIDANDPQSFSGGNIFDISGNGYTHLFGGGATSAVVDGIKCFDCADGEKRIVVNGTGPTLSTTGYTYVVWARLHSDSSLFRTLLYTKSPRYTPITIPDITHPDANKLGYWDTNFRSSGYDISSLVGIWVQYSVVGDNSSQTFYINDYQVGSSISYGAGGTLHDGLGNNLGASQSFGHVGNMMLYNKKLTQEQIKQNYNALKHVYTPEVVMTFTTVGSTTWTAPIGVTSVEYLVVAGGGGGGNGYDNAGGGGGAGGMVLTGTINVTPGQSYTISVGDGGIGGANARANNAGTDGENSVFGSITALGGGRGQGSRTGGVAGAAQVSDTTAPTGGSGSGGGFGGKGGGGAGGAGSNNSGASGGAGGSGVSSSLSGTSVTYGVGGAGGNAGTQNPGVNGTSNRGNGGRAGGAGSSNSTGGGNGGSGIVVIKY